MLSAMSATSPPTSSSRPSGSASPGSRARARPCSSPRSCTISWQAARMPFFDAVAQGRVLRAYLEPQPDDQVPRFDYERHMADLTATPPRWPESTRPHQPASGSRSNTSRRNSGSGSSGYDRLNIDIVDYPGEWLLDLPLLRLDYAEWSRTALEQSGAASRKAAAKDWHAALAEIDPAAPADEMLARATCRSVQGLFARHARRRSRAIDAAARTLPHAGRSRRLARAHLRAARREGRGELSRAARSSP